MKDANIVEMVAAIEGDECAFDQPCTYGHRIGYHAVYCHNTEWEDAPRKCRRTSCSGGKERDEDCVGFEPNVRISDEDIMAMTPGKLPPILREPAHGPLCLFEMGLAERGSCSRCEKESE